MRIFIAVLLIFTANTFLCAEDSPAVQAAKRERERRAKLQPGRSFTNKDIQEYLAKHKSIPGMTENVQEPETQTQTQNSELDESSEAFWQGKHQTVEERISEAQSKIDQIQGDIDTLTKAFYEVSDENRKVEINDVRNKKLDELETARRELDEANQAQDDLEEEARIAGVPPGWVRD
jgi:hypothetical protein